MNNQLLSQIEAIHQILENQATGGDVDENYYTTLRNRLLNNQIIKQYLPQIILDCRKPLDFWDFIKNQFSTYSERRNYLNQQFAPAYRFLESDNSSIVQTDDLFLRQFPIGMPFGLRKPSLAIQPYRGTQYLYFEETSEIGVIRNNVYPNFSASRFLYNLGNAPIFLKHENSYQTLVNICQTTAEQNLLIFYINNCLVKNEELPILIPQAWIQWHSESKKELRSNNSCYADDLYRVDFVAFWNNKRYAILIDDIGHYARQNYSYWNADEEKYSMRLKEDRKLRKEGWEVFRISNWEIRNQQYISEIINDLLDYFEIDKTFALYQEQEIELDFFDDIPF